MKYRILSSITAALILSGCIAACGETAGSSENNAQEETAAAETAAAENRETAPAVQLNIPEEDNGGRDFHVLIPTEKAFELPSEQNGEVVNDELYERTRKTEEHFNIKFSYRIENGGWDRKDQYNKIITGAVLAGDSSFDLVHGMTSCTVPISMHGVFIDLASQDDLNLENPWWLGGLYENLNIGGKLYFALGDSNLSIYQDCCCVFFNAKLIEDFKLENPYDIVRNGGWVMAKMLEMSQVVAADLDGDSVMKIENDRFGAYGNGTPMRFFQADFGVKIIDRDENNNLIVAPVTERVVKAFEYVNSFNTLDYLCNEAHPNDEYYANQTFCVVLCEDRALFHMSYLYITQYDMMRNMQSDFGIIPYPKLDEDQTAHLTQIGTSSNLSFIPKTASDPGLTCRVLETMNYHSMLDVVPAYYTVALEQKYTRDKDVPEMLTIIRDGMIMDFSFAYSTSFPSPWPNVVFIECKKDIVSYIEKNSSKWAKTLEGFVEESE